ncbi:hypothetical protein [Microbacterium sp.]|uniref:hypothetical protein n=1 Tax=Microbacterium sp. TaxID=51671 RepID=UPI0039E6FA94
MSETKPARVMLYAVVTAAWGSGDVAGTLYDHEGEPIHGHMSSNEWFLWRDLTTNFPDRARLLDERYPDGYDVTCIGKNAGEEEFAALHALWDAHHPGWRDAPREGS